MAQMEKKNKFLKYNYYWGCDMYILYRNIQTKIVPSRTLLKRLRSHNTDLRRLICCIRKCLLTLTLIHSDFPAGFSSVTLTPCCGSALCTPIGTRPSSGGGLQDFIQTNTKLVTPTTLVEHSLPHASLSDEVWHNDK